MNLSKINLIYNKYKFEVDLELIFFNNKNFQKKFEDKKKKKF